MTLLTICDVSGLGTPCSPTDAAAPAPAAPLVAEDELDDGLFANVNEELEEGMEREVYLRFGKGQFKDLKDSIV